MTRSPASPIRSARSGSGGPAGAREDDIESGSSNAGGPPGRSGGAADKVSGERVSGEKVSGEKPAASRSRAGEGALAEWTSTWQPEDAPLLAARQRAAEMGVGAVDAPTGAILRMLAAAAGGKAVVELGTGAGVSTLWLMRGMRPDGILTSVDCESEHQRLAKTSLTEAGVPVGRARLIAGHALQVLPRLSDAAYDLLFCDAARSENLDYLEAALRLLRPSGLVVFAGALAGGRIAEPSARDPEIVALRELAKTVRDEPHFVPAALPVGSGLLVAARMP